MVSLLIKFNVSFVFGTCTVIKSHFPQKSSRFAIYLHPADLTASSVLYGSYTQTFIPNAKAAFATLCPILPSPITPKVFPKTSIPVNFALSQLPAFVEMHASGIFLTIDNIIATVCSAAAFVFPSGEFTTIIPF